MLRQSLSLISHSSSINPQPSAFNQTSAFIPQPSLSPQQLVHVLRLAIHPRQCSVILHTDGNPSSIRIRECDDGNCQRLRVDASALTAIILKLFNSIQFFYKPFCLIFCHHNKFLFLLLRHIHYAKGLDIILGKRIEIAAVWFTCHFYITPE